MNKIKIDLKDRDKIINKLTELQRISVNEYNYYDVEIDKIIDKLLCRHIYNRLLKIQKKIEKIDGKYPYPIPMSSRMDNRKLKLRNKEQKMYKRIESIRNKEKIETINY
ncbi:MAG: hypothetical protein ACFFG0_51060 [Candidatus Thorarchaeota archaeon]